MNGLLRYPNFFGYNTLNINIFYQIYISFGFQGAIIIKKVSYKSIISYFFLTVILRISIMEHKFNLSLEQPHSTV